MSDDDVSQFGSSGEKILRQGYVAALPRWVTAWYELCSYVENILTNTNLIKGVDPSKQSYSRDLKDRENSRACTGDLGPGKLPLMFIRRKS
jgi:hypothetical protein